MSDKADARNQVELCVADGASRCDSTGFLCIREREGGRGSSSDRKDENREKVDEFSRSGFNRLSGSASLEACQTAHRLRPFDLRKRDLQGCGVIINTRDTREPTCKSPSVTDYSDSRLSTLHRDRAFNGFQPVSRRNVRHAK